MVLLWLSLSSNRTLWTIEHIFLILGNSFVLLLIIISRFAWFSLLHKLLSLPFLNEFLYLFLQVPAIFSVVAVVLLEAVIFSLVAHIGWWVQWLWPLEVMIVLNLYQNFINEHNQRGKFYHPRHLIVPPFVLVWTLTISPFSFTSPPIFSFALFFFGLILFLYWS